jgi:hypothetical protein
MAEIVNLRRARKDKARAEKDAAAEQNRLQSGRSKAEKQATAAENVRAAQILAAHRRDPGEPGTK